MIVSTPGRICLFGEHQDYLGLPIIAAAISKRIQVISLGKLEKEFIIHLPDVQKIENFELKFPLEYSKDRDYFKSILNVLSRKGHSFGYGLKLEVRGNIPINSGTSSSSALNVSFLNFLNHEFALGYNSQEIGEIAYEAEVLEFGEPGGMMDQYSTAVGKVIYLASVPEIKIKSFNKKLGTFVLGDSLDPKDTLGILSRVKFGTLAGLEKIQKEFPSFSIHSARIDDLEKVKGFLTEDEYILIKSNISDREILKNALDLFQGEIEWSDEKLGILLNKHQENLREHKRISTPKIDSMIQASLDAGALGAKINGSGGGGCMFAYAPHNAQKVADAIESVGGKAYIIEVDNGTQVEEL